MKYVQVGNFCLFCSQYRDRSRLYDNSSQPLLSDEEDKDSLRSIETRVAKLRSHVINVGSEVRQQNDLLDRMNNGMETARKAMDYAKNLLVEVGITEESRYYVLGALVFAIFLLMFFYYLTK